MTSHLSTAASWYAFSNVINFKVKLPHKYKNVEQSIDHTPDSIGVISGSCIKALQLQKSTMEAKLLIKLAEIEQYQAIIEQFPEATSLAVRLQSEAKDNAASIVE